MYQQAAAEILDFRYYLACVCYEAILSFDVLCRTLELLNIIEFSSARKRMSVIIKNEEGKLLLLCKGADRFVRKTPKSSSIMIY